ncbi:uncharacterized protein LOC131319231 isoform X2 [Rhododendron vialii]|uniref:uncharacterized protein LOC131319231 isoform X2 n=1 Tax=Rhododendron vialii TaxID=182163 RepID=UPI00265FF038|nr:uncharacterized protein LOC131319231 isoform X2 [Rhododendron vialii]
MDWAVWDQTLDQDALGSNFIGRAWQGDFYFGSGIDVIEENALNEKSCIQVLQLLISRANAEILELEEDLIILQSQLAWADESWSETCSAALNGKIDCLDISLRSLENADVHGEHDFGGCLLSHSEPAEKIHQILQPLLENYFHQEHEQTVNSVVSKDDLSLETENKDVAEKDKHALAIIKDLSSDTSGQETDESSEKKELAKFDLKVDGKDGLRKNNSGSEERSLVVKSTLKTAGKGRILPRTFEPSSASSLDASKQANSPKGKNSRIVSEVNGRKEVKGHSSTGQIIILKSSFRQNSAPTNNINNIEPPLSSFKLGKKRTKSPRKLNSPDVGVTNTEKKAVDSLLLFLKNKKEQKGKSKLAAIVGESNPNLSPRPQKQSKKREHQQKQKAKRVLDVDKEKKRKRQTSPGVEEAKKLKSLQISLAKSCANTTASTNAEDPSDTKCLFTCDSVTPRPCPEARVVLDLERLTLVDLKAIAKQQKIRGYSSLKKSKLTEELSLKLVRGGCT